MEDKKPKLHISVRHFQNHIEFGLSGFLGPGTFTGMIVKVRISILERSEAKPLKAIVFDLTHLDFINSSGLSTLVNLHRRFAPVHIYGAHDIVLGNIEIVGLNKLFKVYSDRTDFLNDKEFKKLYY